MHLGDVASVDLVGRVEACLIVVAVGVQEIIGVLAGTVEHILRDGSGRSSGSACSSDILDFFFGIRDRACKAERECDGHRTA